MALAALLAAGLLAARPASAGEASRVEDVIPLTMGNIRGHKMLFDEGWFVVTSSSKALAFAREKSIGSSRSAIQAAVADASGRNADLKRELRADAGDASRTARDVAASGRSFGAQVSSGTRRAAASEFAYAEKAFGEAADSFVRGNLSIGRRTEEDRRALAALPGGYFRDLRGDFSNVYELAQSASRSFGGNLEPGWEDAFRRASADFKAEYDRSGEKKNSLAALGPILYGYLKAFYHGLAAPAAKSIVKTAAVGTAGAVFLPASAVIVVSGRTVESLGLTVYHASKLGVAIVSPTAESGLLGGLSLLSLTAVPATYAAGATLGALNQVSFAAAAPAAGAGRGAGQAAAHSAAYVAFVSYDALKGTTKVFINQASSGLVLGYNALTQIPTQTLLGLGDAAVFLGWDGPRLMLAAASGKIKSGGKEYAVGEVPAGTVVDLKKLGQTPGVTVEVISTDPAVINRVLEKVPDDARQADAKP